MKKKDYKISVDGCDDSTEIRVLLNVKEAALVQMIAEKITAASTYGCMPRMFITEAK